MILACVFRKNLKKKEKELEFEMTDVRNVARINKPAAPYYAVEEEGDSSHTTFSGDFEKQANFFLFLPVMIGLKT